MANIVPTSASSTFPGCALSCALLLQAQTLCYPPNIPQANQIAYDQCFCTQPIIGAIYSTPDSVCAGECTIEADRQLLQSWYKNFCVLVSQGQDPVAQTSSQAATASTSAATASATAGGSTISSGGSASSNSSGSNRPWVQTHWKWILMLVILAVGLSALAGLMIWIKRRHRRKLEAKRASNSGFKSDTEKNGGGLKRSATPDLWGPHQMMQATKGYQYATDGVVAESSKRQHKRKADASVSKENDEDKIDVADVSNRALSPSRSSQRARPSELEKNARLIGAADRQRKNSQKKEKTRMTDKDIEASLQGKKKSKPRNDDESEKV